MNRLERLATVAFIGLVIVVVVFAALSGPRRRVVRDAPLVPAADAHFVDVGKAYEPQLAKTYAAAWNAGADKLDAGFGPAEALDVVAKTWASGRTAIFDANITPELAKIVPESIDDADVTPAERTALAAAFRGLAKGLAP
jgi:hypothetical protein